MLSIDNQHLMSFSLSRSDEIVVVVVYRCERRLLFLCRFIRQCFDVERLSLVIYLNTKEKKAATGDDLFVVDTSAFR